MLKKFGKKNAIKTWLVGGKKPTSHINLSLFIFNSKLSCQR